MTAATTVQMTAAMMMEVMTIAAMMMEVMTIAAVMMMEVMMILPTMIM